jgi:hypothetical protein
MVGNFRARAVAWWRRSHADLQRRDFRRVGLSAFGVVGGSVVLARLTQDTAVAGAVRAFAITVFALAAIALLGVVILMGEEVVDEMDASDPMRARHGGAYGPRIKQFVRAVPRETWAVVASIPGKIGGLRRSLTRRSLSRMAVVSVDALGGVPPVDVRPPHGAGPLAQPIAVPPESDSGSSDDPTEPGRRAAAPLRARRRALTASELSDRPPVTARRRAAEPRSARRARRTRRFRRGVTRTSRFVDTETRPRD